MRFDDSLATVLSADMRPGAGAQAAWRQLVDLTGRGRVAADGTTMTQLRTLRPVVPQTIRAASARALALARPGADLVRFFAEDDVTVSAPLLRIADLPEDAWLDLLPRLTPAARAVLRGRRDLPAGVERGLASLGAIDFTLPGATSPVATPGVADLEAAALVDPSPMEVSPASDTGSFNPSPNPAASSTAPLSVDGWNVPGNSSPHAPLSPTPFVALGDVARGLPVVAEALRRSEEDPPAPRFEIADIVARIDAFQRDREAPVAVTAATAVPATAFRFATDASGVVRWVDGVSRTALVGVSLAQAGRQALTRIDAAAAGAVRARARFSGARLEIDGVSDAAGSWRIAAAPDFDPASGRFVGYQGIARRPARHEQAEANAGTVADQLRQLVHELRTPVNAIAGFAELIETELLGSVAVTYRGGARDIRDRAGELLTAIDDLDTAARLESGALDLRAGVVALAPLIDRVVGDLAPLAAARGAVLAPGGERILIAADDRAVERLFARLLATVTAAASTGERIAISVEGRGAMAEIAVDRPIALADVPDRALFAIDDGDAEDGAPLLGAAFTLRLVRNLAAELGGALAISADRLTLRLPAARPIASEQASIH